MEIRNVVNEVKNEYPKVEQVSKKRLSNSIPRRWLKVGLSSLGISIIFQNNVLVFALAGGSPTMTTTVVSTPAPIRMCNIVCPRVEIVSAVIFIITGLCILITKIKARKQSEPKRAKKWIKILFMISIIVFIISVLTGFIINIIDYYYY